MLLVVSNDNFSNGIQYFQWPLITQMDFIPEVCVLWIDNVGFCSHLWVQSTVLTLGMEVGLMMELPCTSTVPNSAPPTLQLPLNFNYRLWGLSWVWSSTNLPVVAASSCCCSQASLIRCLGLLIIDDSGGRARSIMEIPREPDGQFCAWGCLPIPFLEPQSRRIYLLSPSH